MRTTHKIKITFTSGQYKYIFANRKKLINAKNVLQYVFGKYDKATIREIKTRCRNEQMSCYYWDLNYTTFFENALNNNLRVQAENPKGHEDFTGYGCRTDGRFNRFTIGRSSGWIPIYLEILTSRSMGGGSLYVTKGRKFSIVY